MPYGENLFVLRRGRLEEVSCYTIVVGRNDMRRSMPKARMLFSWTWVFIKIAQR